MTINSLFHLCWIHFSVSLPSLCNLITPAAINHSRRKVSFWGTPQRWIWRTKGTRRTMRQQAKKLGTLDWIPKRGGSSHPLGIKRIQTYFFSPFVLCVRTSLPFSLCHRSQRLIKCHIKCTLSSVPCCFHDVILSNGVWGKKNTTTTTTTSKKNMK